MSDAEEWFVETPVEIHLADTYAVAVGQPGETDAGPPQIASDAGEEGRTRGQTAYSPTQKDCGPICLYLCCRLAGIPCSWESARDVVSPAGGDVTMLALKHGGEHLGFRACACQVSWDRLYGKMAEPGTYAVLHVSGNHFVCVAGRGAERRLRVADPAFGIREYAEGDFRAAYDWHGISLFLAASP